MGWWWWLQTDKFFQVKWDDDPQWLSCFSGLKASCRVFSKFPSIFTNLGQQRMRHNEYDHSRARECLGLALGFLMNYDELWWTLEFKSRSFPYRRTVRRSWWKECRPGAWDSEQWLSPHRSTSTYRHIDMACLKNFFPLPRTMIYDVIFFRHVPIQELSHLMWWNLFRFVLFRNHHIWCDFFSVIFLFRNSHIWCEICSDFFLFRNDHIWCDSCSEIVLFRNFHISC